MPLDTGELETSVQTIRADRLIRDERVQRSLSEGHVAKLAASMNTNALGTLVVSERSNGDVVILDGSHRVEALLQVGLGDYPCRCVVYKKLSKPEEASLFLRYNDRRNVHILERFRIAVTAKEPEAVQLDRIIRSHGFTPMVNSAHSLTCIGTVIELYRGGHHAEGAHPEIVEETLKILIEAWGTEGSAIKETVRGIGALLTTFGDEVDRQHLVERLQRLKGGPISIRARAQQLRDLRVMRTARESNLRAVLDIYNEGLRAGKRLIL